MESLPFRRRALDHLIRPTRAEVDLSAIAHNLSVVRRLAGPASVLAVLKANAYGHGAVLVARALEQAGVDMLAVAMVEEGLELRNAGVRAPIVVLGGAYDGGYDTLIAKDLVPVVFREDHLQGLARVSGRSSKKVRVHLKIDTGMSRLGLMPDQLGSFLEAARRYPHIEIDGLLSHFANADAAHPLNGEQLRAFARAWAQVKEAGYSPRWRHLSNSAAVLSLPQALEGETCNLVRPGLVLYGHAPMDWPGREALRPVLTWKTAVSHLKTLPAGTPVSYGSTWVAQRESRIAVLPVGYADGYDRVFSSRSHVLIRGRRVPVVGRVCMDMCMADVTDLPEVALHDEVVLLGAQGDARVDLEELAELAQTIPYEVLCGLGARVPRVAV